MDHLARSRLKDLFPSPAGIKSPAVLPTATSKWQERDDLPPLLSPRLPSPPGLYGERPGVNWISNGPWGVVPKPDQRTKAAMCGWDLSMSPVTLRAAVVASACQPACRELGGSTWRPALERRAAKTSTLERNATQTGPLQHIPGRAQPPHVSGIAHAPGGAASYKRSENAAVCSRRSAARKALPSPHAPRRALLHAPGRAQPPSS